MNPNTQYILHKKLDRRTYPKLHLNQTYYCDKIIRKLRIKNIIDVKIRVWINSYDHYEIYEPIFNSHFMTLKEFRKEKLEKLNNVKI